MFNVYNLFRALQPQPLLQAGTVVAVDDGAVVVELPGGVRIRARGEAAMGAQVFVRDGVIQGAASALPRMDQEV